MVGLRPHQRPMQEPQELLPALPSLILWGEIGMDTTESPRWISLAWIMPTQAALQLTHRWADVCHRAHADFSCVWVATHEILDLNYSLGRHKVLTNVQKAQQALNDAWDLRHLWHRERLSTLWGKAAAGFACSMLGPDTARCCVTPHT